MAQSADVMARVWRSNVSRRSISSPVPALRSCSFLAFVRTLPSSEVTASL